MRTCHKPTMPLLISFRHKGFTLVEMMVVIVVMAILLMVAIPSLNEVTLSSKLGTYASDVVASAYQARSEALKRNVPVQFCVSTSGTDCTSGSWEQGWVLAYTDKDNNRQVISSQGAATDGFKISGSVSSITFQPTGLAATEATFTICRATPTAGKQERVVRLSPTGRVSTEKTSNGTCP